MQIPGASAQHRYGNSISRQIVLLLLAFAVFPMVMLTALVYTFESSLQKKEMIQVQSEMADRVAQLVLMHMQGTLNSLKLLALSTEVVELELPRARHTLSSFFHHQSELDGLALAELDGTPNLRLSRLRTYHEDEPERLSDEPGFQNAVGGQVGLGRIHLSSLSKFSQLRLFVPVFGKAERVVRVLCADMSISRMWHLVGRSLISKDFSTFIVDREGILIAGDDLSSVLHRRSMKDLLPVKHFLAGEAGVFEYQGFGAEQVVGTVAQIPLTGWGVVVETPSRLAYRHMHSSWWLLGAASLTMIFVAGSLGWMFIARNILLPIRALQEDVQVIATGDLSHQIRVNRSDELGRLAADLSTMTESLRALTVSREMLIQENRERRKTEEALRESERRLADILDFFPDAVLAIDGERKIIIWNRAIEAMSGIPSEAMIGEGDYAYTIPFYGERRPQLMDLIWDAAEEVKSRYPMVRQEGHSFVAEAFCPMLHDGKGAWIFAKASPLYDRQGKVTGAIESIRDITASKRAEEEKEKLQAQLLQAHKMESVGRLAGGVAHDFNNMLGVIIGHAEMALARTDLSEPIHGNLKEIHDAAERSADLTRQLLAFARRQTVSPKPLNLNDTVHGMLKMLHRLIGEDIQLSWKPADDLWSVKMDPAQVDQVLANLAVNARDATGEGGLVSIETRNVSLAQDYCAAHPECAPGEYVLLTVSDTGVGMDKETIEHLFEPFFTTKELGKGTGLGLATVYGIVKQNGGCIDVYSKPGGGSSFKIYLPRFREVPGVDVRVAEPQPSHGVETVLLVEDEATLLDLSQEVLKLQGYTVLGAHLPSEALNLARSHEGPIHLVITDVVMPEMNGLALMEKIRALRPGISALFMSGYAADAVADHGAFGDGSRFLQKPFSIATLVENVREALDGGRS